MSRSDDVQQELHLLKRLAETLQKKRIERKLSLEEVAEKVRIDKQLLDNIESFNQIPHEYLARGIADALETEGSDYLFQDFISETFLYDSKVIQYSVDGDYDPEIIRDRIGFRIKTLRDRENISQQALSQKTGISQSSLSKLESGSTSIPSRQSLEKIASALKVSFFELINNTEYEALEIHKEEPLFGSISFCPNKNCPNAMYIKRKGNEKPEFFRYNRFPIETEGEKQVRFCKFCGTPLVLACKCGVEITSESQRFCPYCGLKNFPEEPEDLSFGHTDDVIWKNTLSVLTEKKHI